MHDRRHTSWMSEDSYTQELAYTWLFYAHVMSIQHCTGSSRLLLSLAGTTHGIHASFFECSCEFSSACWNAESTSKIQIQVLPNIPPSVFSPVCFLTCRITEVVGGQRPRRHSIAMRHTKPHRSWRPANLVVASARMARGCSLKRIAM